MDRDGFNIQGSNRNRQPAGKLRGRDLHAFYQETPKYVGTEEEFSMDHAKLYGREERLPHGASDSHRNHYFPPGSARGKLYNQYDASTAAMNTSGDRYHNALEKVNTDFDKLSRKEKGYYNRNTGGYTPSQHERLEPLAAAYADKSYNNASGREKFLQTYPVGYQSREEQDEHWGHAEASYQNYEYTERKRSHHSTHMSEKLDPRRDRFGRPMPHR